MQVRLEWWKKVGFSAVLILLALAGVEEVLQHTRIGIAEEKLWFKVEGGFGTCYSSDPAHRFPFSVRESARDRARLREKVVSVSGHPMDGGRALTFSDIVARAPHCIVHHPGDRERGPFPHRPLHVAVLGDSFAFGEGIPEEETVSHLLALRVSGANFRNLGRPGADLIEVREALGAALRDPLIRSVIYLYNLNDVFLRREVPPDVAVYPELVALRRGARSRLRLVAVVQKHRLERRRTALVTRAFLSTYLAPEGQPKLRRALQELGRMDDDARSQGRRFVVVIYPVLHRTLWGAYPFQPIHDRVLRFCREERIACVDGYEAFREVRNFGALRVHPEDSHPTGRANALLVDHLIATGAVKLR